MLENIYRLKVRRLIIKINEIGIKETFFKFFSYTRGLYYSRYFDTYSRIMITGKIKINKKNAILNAGKCKIWAGVKISLWGKDKNKKAYLQIGEYSTIGDRTEIHVGNKIVIGKSVRISWDCVIMDRDYHGIDGKPERVEEVIISDFVWIGCRVIVLPGVRIGEGAVVGAGSVVTKNIGRGEIWGGNPAIQIGKVENIGMIE